MSNGDNGKRATAAWLVPIVIAVMSYGGAQVAIESLKDRVLAGEAAVNALENQQIELKAENEVLQEELDRQRRELMQISGIGERIERAVKRAIEEALAAGR